MNYDRKLTAVYLDFTKSLDKKGKDKDKDKKFTPNGLYGKS